jgi:hypothetical protein
MHDFGNIFLPFVSCDCLEFCPCLQSPLRPSFASDTDDSDDL